MPNRLIDENSPYLLQHAHNPVDWYPWGDEALQKARNENKPIFVSIGYAACHWCHVMEHESFEDHETAAIMNDHFINIKVDREERPDLDSIYMQATVAMTGSGGWPMSVFITPDLKPFFTGTYFPPTRRYNMASFKEVLLGIASAWLNEPREIEKVGERVLQHIHIPDFEVEVNQSQLTQDNLNAAVKSLIESYDWNFGGWGQAPKFPQPMALEFLLRRITSKSIEDGRAKKLCSHALDAMSKGGMYDVVGGGFSRYSVDPFWRTPHFEKMLYDNAQLSLVYLHAYLVLGNVKYKKVCEESLDFVLREMTHPRGGFFSSLDADSEGEEGRFYVWDESEIKAATGPDYEFFKFAYGIKPEGNWDGKIILQRSASDEQLAANFNINTIDLQANLSKLHRKLLSIRNKRVRPATDDKVILMWNSLMMKSLAEAARYLGRQDYLDAARRNASFILDELFSNERLFRSWRNGQAKHNAYLEDYASLILSLLSLYQSDPNPKWYKAALSLADIMISQFSDPKGGFFDTSLTQESLLIRPKDIQDNATPSGNALAATVLLELAAFGDRLEYRDLAEKMLNTIFTAILRYPTSFAQWLCAADFATGPIHEIAVVGSPDHSDRLAMIQVLWESYRPRHIAAISDMLPNTESPALLKSRDLMNGQPTAFVCQNFICQVPVNSAEALRKLLDD